jgi:pyruvate dehydrogenase E1 component alpha subunit
MDLLFAELYGKDTGANGGYAGSQDISYPEKYFYSGAILAGAAAIAAGVALSFKTKGLPQIAISGFGESATDEGIFWETINYAATEKLPVVFICENNKYSVFSPQLKRQARDNLSEKVAAFGVKAIPLFGNDVMSVYRALKEGMEYARSGNGPIFIEAYTYRWSGHYGPASDDLVGYRSNEEIEFWKDNCPIKLLKNVLLSRDIWDSTLEESCSNRTNREIEDAFTFAKESEFPSSFDWELANINPKTPVADKLLKEIEINKFDASQVAEQVKGY